MDQVFGEPACEYLSSLPFDLCSAGCSTARPDTAPNSRHRAKDTTQTMSLSEEELWVSTFPGSAASLMNKVK